MKCSLGCLLYPAHAPYEGQTLISNSAISSSYLSLPGVLEEHDHWDLISSSLGTFFHLKM